jgi:endo-1,4-beta-xylanase
MKMIWDLFGIHITFFLIILILFITWMAWPKKQRKIKKYILLADGVILLVAILLAMWSYWPREFEKTYLDSKENHGEYESFSLSQLADSVDFYIGMAVKSDSLYHHWVPKEFNSVTAENDFKSARLLKDPSNWTYDFRKADELLSFSESRGMRMRGHTLIWGKFPGMTHPAGWIKMVNDSDDPETTLRNIIVKNVTEIMTHFKGKVHTWDVVNEPMGGEVLFNDLFSRTLGEEYIDLAFQTAREVDPSCELILNEAIGDYNGPQGQAFLQLLQRLTDRGVPIDGVGLQSHHINAIHDVDALKEYMRAIGEMGLTVEITELDMRLLLFKDSKDPYQAQGDQFYEITKACLEEPACKGLTFWGITDRENWMDGVPPFKWKSPNAPYILDEDLNKKPAYWGIHKALSEFYKQSKK